MAALVTMAFQYAPAQENQKTPSAQLLSLYFDIKDALVAGNAAAASNHAEGFAKAISTLDAGLIDEAKRSALSKDAGAIASAKDLNAQRLRFSSFSDKMIALAKSVKLSGDPIYEQYCPMKKASWLSGQTVVRNPYYGSAMLACGKVNATL